jgi:hypothetical protein
VTKRSSSSAIGPPRAAVRNARTTRLRLATLTGLRRSDIMLSGTSTSCRKFAAHFGQLDRVQCKVGKGLVMNHSRVTTIAGRATAVVSAAICLSCGASPGHSKRNDSPRSPSARPSFPTLGPGALSGASVVAPPPPSSENCSSLPESTVPDGVDTERCRLVAMQVATSRCTSSSGSNDLYYLVTVGRIGYYGRTGHQWHYANATLMREPDRLAHRVGCV